MSFAGSGQEALDDLSQKPFDVVVSDMRMPGMDGAQLLTEVKKRHPHVARIILSGQSEEGFIIKAVPIAHQYLAKPCEPDLLKSLVTRTCRLRGLLADDAIKRIVCNIESLPSLSSLYTEIVEEVQSPNTSIAKLGKIISRDMGMTAKVLQLVNSAFFGLQQHVSNATQAVTLLGTDTIRALVLSVHIFSQYKSTPTSLLSLEELTRHSFLTGILAKTLAREENQRQIVIDDSFMAGLLHDVGKPILSINFPDQYRKAWGMVQEKKIFPWEAEKQIFGVTHSEVGAYLTGLWGLPDSIVEGLAFHHNPNQCQAGGFSPLVAVHAASALEKEGGQADIPEARQQINREYLGTLGLLPRLPVWEEVCRKVIAGGQGND